MIYFYLVFIGLTWGRIKLTRVESSSFFGVFLIYIFFQFHILIIKLLKIKLHNFYFIIFMDL